MLNPLGRNWGPLVNWDDLGKFFAAFAISWTVILYSGIAWLLYYHKLPSIRMRNVPLIIASTTCLHVYLIKIVLAYTTNGNFLCSAEFWIMSIYLPFGIALFQANMVQLLSISTQQRKLLDGDRASILQHAHPAGLRGIWSRWRALNPLKQAYIFIGVGMVVQVCIRNFLRHSILTIYRSLSLPSSTLRTQNSKVSGVRLLSRQVRSNVEKVQNGRCNTLCRVPVTNSIGSLLRSGNCFGLLYTVRT